MKTHLNTIIAFLSFTFLISSCQDQDDVVSIKVNDFVWKGMNLYYLWQADVPNLSDDKFKNQQNLNNFLSTFSQPEVLFENLLHKPDSKFPKEQAVDRFSWIVDDYLVLEGQLQGNTNSSGIEFGLSRKKKGSNELFGVIRYIIPNSDASTKNIKRGEIFDAVDGKKLTIKEYGSLLFGNNNNYTLNMVDLTDGKFTPNGKSVSLTKTPLVENPILINKVIEKGSHKIGYLMYNGFYSNYDNKLNDAFGTLKSQGITDLVLDLRYNGGGSVLTATRLASMITGSFTGQIFAKQQWNSKIESYFTANNPEVPNDRFESKMGSKAINSLNLKKVYILTTVSSASASELVINGLKPYMDVIQIGDTTTGKNIGSVTLYDSPTFTKEKRNKSHRYAMQPLVFKTVNSQGFGDYQNGLVPTFLLEEKIGNFNILGETSEPLLAFAIEKITGIKPSTNKIRPGKTFDFYHDSKPDNAAKNQMYLENAPEGLLKSLD